MTQSSAETNSFYQETVAQARTTNTDENKQARSSKRDTLQTRVTNFYNSFMTNWKEQVTKAAEKGLGKTNIFTYKTMRLYSNSITNVNVFLYLTKWTYKNIITYSSTVHIYRCNISKIFSYFIVNYFTYLRIHRVFHLQ